MSDPVSPESSMTIPALFFGKLADDHGDLTETLEELALQIKEQNLHGIFDVLSDIDNRVQLMRNISIIFDGYVDRHKQLMTSLNQNPKEGL